MLGDTRHRHDPGVEDANPILTDGAHGELRLIGDSQLADHDHVEWGVETGGHLIGHRDTSPG
jgi:hypothetical protein